MATKQSLLAAAAACISLLLLLLPSASSSLTDFEYCDKGKDYPVKVSGVKMVPDVVIGGDPNFFTIYASTDKTITEGKLVTSITCGSFHVHSEAEDICTLTSCPATADFQVSHQLDMPSTDPNGAYTIRMVMLGEKYEELSCISLGYTLTGGIDLELNFPNLLIA